MPEISLCLFDLKQLLRLFPKQDKELRRKILDYEQKAQENMAENRLNLFKDFGYQSEFDEKIVFNILKNLGDKFPLILSKKK